MILDLTLQTRKFPKIWKSAIVIALFKKGIKSDPSNYRPISLLSCVGKVFERVVFKPSCRHSSMSLTSSEVICRVSILLPVRS
jgi:hypothetical protein